MKANPFIAILAIFTLFSCDMLVGNKDLISLSMSETKEAKTLTVSGQQRSLKTVEGQQLIIIQDEDTARYVIIDGEKFGPCNAVYHDQKQPWANGKTVIAVKDNVAHLFIIIQDRDGARRLTHTALPLDAAANLVNNPDGSFRVQNLQFNDGTTRDFNSNDSAVE